MIIAITILLLLLFLVAIALRIDSLSAKSRGTQIKPRPTQAQQRRPQIVMPASLEPQSEDDQAIRDHERLVEQYKGLVDELYGQAEDIVRRSRHES